MYQNKMRVFSKPITKPMATFIFIVVIQYLYSWPSHFPCIQKMADVNKLSG